MNLTPYHAKYFAHELTKRSPSNSIQKLVTSRVRQRNKNKKKEAKKILSLENKVKTQKEIKELEVRRNEIRRTLFQAQDDIDLKKERLIDEIEARLR